MAALRGKTVTLSGTTASAVTFPNFYSSITVTNHDTTAGHNIFVTTNGVTAVANADDNFAVLANSTVTIPNMSPAPQQQAVPAETGGTSISIVGLGANNNVVTVIGNIG